jgi:hypothetical protein
MTSGRVLNGKEVLKQCFPGMGIIEISALRTSASIGHDVKLQWNDRSNSIVLSRCIVDLFANENFYILFDEYGIWPSSENAYTFRALCNYYTGEPEFSYSDALAFQPDDEFAATSFLSLALDSGWGGLVVQAQRAWFCFSHDSWGLLAHPIREMEGRLDLPGVRALRSP